MQAPDWYAIADRYLDDRLRALGFVLMPGVEWDQWPPEAALDLDAMTPREWSAYCRHHADIRDSLLAYDLLPFDFEGTMQ
jgi:hypothetical protein